MFKKLHPLSIFLYFTKIDCSSYMHGKTDIYAIQWNDIWLAVCVNIRILNCFKKYWIHFLILVAKLKFLHRLLMSSSMHYCFWLFMDYFFPFTETKATWRAGRTCKSLGITSNIKVDLVTIPSQIWKISCFFCVTF